MVTGARATISYTVMARARLYARGRGLLARVERGRERSPERLRREGGSICESIFDRGWRVIKIELGERGRGWNTFEFVRCREAAVEWFV